MIVWLSQFRELSLFFRKPGRQRDEIPVDLPFWIRMVSCFPSSQFPLMFLLISRILFSFSTGALLIGLYWSVCRYLLMIAGQHDGGEDGADVRGEQAIGCDVKLLPVPGQL